MAEAVEFPEQNTLVHAPKDNDEILPLPAHVDKEQSLIISCWKFTPQEIEYIKNNGYVYLMIHGTAQPPVLVLAENIFIQSDETE